MDKEFYLPAVENLAAQSQSNRQGRGDVLTGDQAKKVLDLLKKMLNKLMIIMKLCLTKDMMVQ